LDVWSAAHEGGVETVLAGELVEPVDDGEPGGVDELKLSEIEDDVAHAASVQAVERTLKLWCTGEIEFPADDHMGSGSGVPHFDLKGRRRHFRAPVDHARIMARGRRPVKPGTTGLNASVTPPNVEILLHPLPAREARLGGREWSVAAGVAVVGYLSQLVDQLALLHEALVGSTLVVLELVQMQVQLALVQLALSRSAAPVQLALLQLALV